MSQLLHVCLYNADAESSVMLQDHLRALNFVRLVAEVRAPDDLIKRLQEQEINLVFFHLDPDPGPVIELLELVSTRHPGVAMIAISDRTNPAAILAPMRAGCDQFVCKPIDRADLANAVARVASRRFMSRTQGRCVCVTGSSGGVGATSIACNLALEIGHITNTETALVDLSLQFGDAAMIFDCNSKYTLYDLADFGGTLDRASLSGAVTKLPCRVSLLTRPKLVEQCDVITQELVKEVLDLLANDYENTVVDVPRRVDPCSYAAFKQADHVLIVCQLLVPSVHNAKRFYDALSRMGIPEERMVIIVNRADSKSSRISQDDIHQMIGKPVYATVPNDFEFVARSLDLGRPAAALDRKNYVRSAIRKIARKITGVEEETKNDAEKRGLLARFFQ